MIHDGENNSIAQSNIVIVPVADQDPVINPDGDPTLTEHMGPTSIVYAITDDDQVDEHRLIDWVNISLSNALGNEVSIYT